MSSQPPHLIGPSGEIALLATRTLVGSGSPCHLRIRSRYVSYVHMLVSAGPGGSWQVADLGSTNGTRHNGSRMERESRALKVGDELQLGGREGPVWRVGALGEPVGFAVHLASGRVVVAEHEGLFLPDESAAEVGVFKEDGQWWAERDGGPTPLAHEDHLEADGVWRLHLPAQPDGTLRREPVLDPTKTELHLRHSRDFEHFEAWLTCGDERIPLGTEKYWVLAYVMGKDRAEDDGPEYDRGWVEIGVLADWMGVKRRCVDTYVTRLRERLVRAGLSESTLIQGQRIGYRRITMDVHIHGPES